MNPSRPESASHLDDALARLPRDVEPGRDLWPAIQAGLEPQRTQTSRRWFWPAAAAIVLVAASSLLTASLLRRGDPPVATTAAVQMPVTPSPAAFGPGQVLGPTYDAARLQLLRSLSARIERMPPAAREKLESNLAELRRASAEINAALELRPGDPLLEELLLNTYQDELAVLASVNQITGAATAGATPEETRIQL
jgi:hypothetical protein